MNVETLLRAVAAAGAVLLAGRTAGRVPAAAARTIADIAPYAHGTGALPPGVEGGLDAQTVYRD